MNAVIQPGGMISPGAPPPAVRLPTRDLFLHRSRRFHTLARGHAMEGYLTFMGDLAAAQHDLMAESGHHEPEEAVRRSRVPPAFGDPAQDPAWRAMLHRLLRALSPKAPAPTQAVIRDLLQASDEALARIMQRVLGGGDPLRDPVADPLIAAALQVQWARRASALAADAIQSAGSPHLCPVCGAPPVASVVHAAGLERGVRYLHCALCESEWRLPRIQCSHCDSEKGVVYLRIEGNSEAIKAETCDDCRTYLKIFHRDKDQEVDPIADDLASLGLDLAMADAGYARSGPNLLFVPGEENH